MNESKAIEDGRALGYKREELQNYVTERLEREKKKLLDDADRENRMKDREAERETARLEIENRNLELRLQVAQAQNTGDASIVQPPESRSYIKLTPYKDGENVVVYLRTFDRVREANNWTECVAITALLNAFTNTKVGDFLDTIGSDRSLNLIKSDIIRSFGLNVYDYVHRFRNAKQVNESFSQFVVQLRENLAKMCELANVEKNFDKLVELCIKDQLLRSVDRNLSEYLKEHDIFHIGLNEVIKLADNFQAIHGKHHKFPKPDNRSKPQPDTKSATVEKTCYSCGKKGHVSKFCKYRLSSLVVDSKESSTSDLLLSSKDTKTLVCFKCKKPGHFARNCLLANSRNSADTVLARGDGNNNVKVNFTLDSCAIQGKLPLAMGRCNDRGVCVLRDTGSTAVLVRSDLVDTTKLTHEIVNVSFADGRSMKARKSTINLESVFYSGAIEAICLPDLPFDVLVGNVPGALCACSAKNITLSKTASTECEASFCCAVTTRSQAFNENVPNVQTKVSNKQVMLDMANVSAADLIKMQLCDSSLKSCFAKTAKQTETYPKFILQNEVLVRVSNKSKVAKNLVHQIVLPQCLRRKVMSLAHDTVMSGHLGVGKTQARILNHFFWPDVYGDIRRFCRSCEICQKNFSGRPAKYPLVNLPVIDTPFKRVAIDLIGPLIMSTKGNRFALVFIDLATKYPDAVALKHIDSDSVAEALLNIFSRVGLPTEILHDRGAQFISAVMKRFNQLLQIKSITTAAYNPKCNGSCENFNKTLKQMIRKITEDNPDTWDRYLQPLLFAYREVPQTSTGFSPFELIYGHEVRGPLFLMKERILSNVTEEEVPVTSYVLEMRERIREYLKVANESENRAKQKEKIYYDRTCRKRNFKLGDKVLLLLPTSAIKLVAEWKGPFTVVRKLNKVDYVVRIDDRERTYHVNMLKPFYEREKPQPEIANAVVDLDLASKLDYDISEELRTDEYAKLREILSSNGSVFNTVPGKLTNSKYSISVDPNIKPIVSLPYKVPFQLKDKVKSELDKWLSNGIIVKSNSKFASPMVVVKNSDMSIRLTVDFRKLNPHINVDNFPMPERDSVIERLHSAKFMTKLDLTKAFFQIPLAEDSRKYTSFVTEYGQFEFTVVPFGIRFASGLCNRIISNLLTSHQAYITSFVDDLVIYSTDFESHLAHVEAVLSDLASAGVTLNAKKM